MGRAAMLAALTAALTGMFVGCAGGQKEETTTTTEEEVVRSQPAEKLGVISSVDGERLMIKDPNNPRGEPLLFERTTESIVVEDGKTVDWSQLEEGDAVTVAYDEGIFGPNRAVRVEVIPPEEAQPPGLESPQPVIPDADGNGMDTPGEMGPRPVEPDQPDDY